VLTSTGGVFRLQFVPDRARTPPLNASRILFFKREREREREKEKARRLKEKEEGTERIHPPVNVK